MKWIKPKYKPAEQVKEERCEALSDAHGRPPKVKISGMLEFNGQRLIYLECLSCGHRWQSKASPDLADLKTEIGRSFLAGLCKQCERNCPCNPLNKKPAHCDVILEEGRME